MEYYKGLLIDSQMIQLLFSIKQMKIENIMGVLHSFVWIYVKYANMEGFHRDSHLCGYIQRWSV